MIWDAEWAWAVQLGDQAWPWLVGGLAVGLVLGAILLAWRG